MTDGERAGHVGSVAVDGGAAVHDDQVAGGDGPGAGLVVGAGRVRTRGDDGVEGEPVRAQPQDGRLERTGQLHLGDALGEPVDHLGQGPVGDGGGGAHASHLGGVLDHPGTGHDALGGDQLDTVQGLEPAPLLGPGDVLGLEGEPGVRRHGVHDGGPLVVGPAHHEADLGADPVGLLGGALPVAPVGQQHQLVGGEQHQPGRPREAGEPAHVGRIRDEQRSRHPVEGRQLVEHLSSTRPDGHRRQRQPICVLAPIPLALLNGMGARTIGGGGRAQGQRSSRSWATVCMAST